MEGISQAVTSLGPCHVMELRHQMTPDYCGAKKKQGSGTCTMAPGWGTSHPGSGHCKLHGGSTPGGIEAAAKQELVLMGKEVDVEPHEALMWCVRIAAGEVAYCNGRISILDEDQEVVRPTETRTEDFETDEGAMGTRTSTMTYREELNLWIKIRMGAVDRLARYSKMALDAGVEERRVRLAERWGEDIAALLQNILGDLRLSKEQEQRAPEIVQRHLLTIEGVGREKVPA